MPKYIKPTSKTKFHVDFNWWLQDGHSLHRTLLDNACSACRAALEDESEVRTVDWVDPQTAQVFVIDQLWQTIHTHCSQDPEYLSEYLPMTTAILRMFIANDNAPLTPIEMQQKLPRRGAGVILKTIGGHRVYQGIRPVMPLIA